MKQAGEMTLMHVILSYVLTKYALMSLEI